MSPLEKKMKVSKRLPAWALTAETVLQTAVNKAVKRQRAAGLPIFAMRQGKLRKVTD